MSRYLEKRAKGLCGSCGRKMHGNRKTQCGTCQEQQAVRERATSPSCKCGAKLALYSTFATCAPCRKKATDKHREWSSSAGDDYFHFPTPSPESRQGGHSQAVERQCVSAYRVERYSPPLRAWEVLMYASPLARAQDHAKACLESYRVAPGGVPYTAVRVCDSAGTVLQEQRK